MFSDVWRPATNGVLRGLFAEGYRLSAGRVRIALAPYGLSNTQLSLLEQE
jgi:hypothetical protein